MYDVRQLYVGYVSYWCVASYLFFPCIIRLYIICLAVSSPFFLIILLHSNTEKQQFDVILPCSLTLRKRRGRCNWRRCRGERRGSGRRQGKGVVREELRTVLVAVVAPASIATRPNRPSRFPIRYLRSNCLSTTWHGTKRGFLGWSQILTGRSIIHYGFSSHWRKKLRTEKLWYKQLSSECFLWSNSSSIRWWRMSSAMAKDGRETSSISISGGKK